MIANTFIKRPVTAIVISIVFVLLGTLAILSLPISQYPEITPPVVSVSSTFTGADALTVEQTVTTPVETEINGTPGMDYISSNSTSDGRSSLSVTLEVGTNADIATLDIQNRVGIATPKLPDDVKRLGIVTRKRNPSILMLVTLYSPNGTHGIPFLDNYSSIFVKDALLRVKGVGDIFVIVRDFSMRVWLQPDKLANLGLTPMDVENALREQNLQMAAGSVGAPPQEGSQAFEYTVFTNSKLATQDQFKNIVVRTKPEDGSIVYLKDVARVELGKFTYTTSSFVDGQPASFMMIFQAPNSNALEVANGIRQRLEELKQSFPVDVDYKIPFESVSVVEVSINEVIDTLIEALILVTIVVFIFLQSWRATLIPILAIPVSIIGTFAFFLPLGFTINTLTLFGFVLAIGIVVDDAIVVVEAVQHYIDEEHMNPRDATYHAMKDISGPVVAIALILAAVFIPVGFIPGIVGRLYQQFAITIAISVLISAFVALSLTPALCSLILRPMHVDAKAKGVNKIFYKFNEWFRRVTLHYTVGVRKLLKGIPYALIVLVCIYVGAGILLNNKSTGFIPVEDEGRVIITYELPDAASASRSLQVLDSIMNIVRKEPTVKNYSGISGLNAITFATKSSSGTLFLNLKHWDERKADSAKLNSVVRTLQAKFAAIKGANIMVIVPPAIPGLGQTGGFTYELQQRSSTDDINQFEKVVQNFIMEANKRPELSRVFTFFTARTPGYQVDVDRERCKKMGVSISDVYNTLQSYLGSRYVNDFTLYGRNFRVVTQADTAYRGSVEDLGKYYVRNQSGVMVPLSTLINYKVIEMAPLISHYNLFRSAEINGNAAEGYSSGDALAALQDLSAKILPQGYGYEFSGLSREEINAGSQSTNVFILSLVFVFLFLSALYESWSVPWSVLLAVPISVFGAILTLTLIPRLSNNVYAQIGLITLIGLSAKNAILIVEYAKVRVDNGMAIVPATLDAVKLRLRPIIMTSLAFILGVLPLAFAQGAASESRATIGWTVLGGMLAATLIGIFIVPVLFVLICRIAYGKKKLEELRLKALEAEQGIPYDTDEGDTTEPPKS